jgi:hypothetical protein
VDALVRLVSGSERDAVQEETFFQEMVGVYLPCRNLSADVDPRQVAERVMDYVRSLSVLEKGESG